MQYNEYYHSVVYIYCGKSTVTHGLGWLIALINMRSNVYFIIWPVPNDQVHCLITFLLFVDREFVDQSPRHHEAVWLWQRHYCCTLPRLQLVCSQEIYGGRWGKKCKKLSSPSAHPALCYINISTSLTSSWHCCPLVALFCHHFDCDLWIVTIIVEMITWPERNILRWLY